MKVSSHNKKHHVFVCCRSREGKPSCGGKGSVELTEDLKKWVKSKNLKDQVRVAQSSCLGRCAEGIAVAFFPENQWLTEVSPENVKNIQDIILGTISLRKL